jgi:hypothetical protein
VHGYALKMSIDGGEQPDNFDILALTKDVERPRTIFTAAPGKKNLPFQRASLNV